MAVKREEVGERGAGQSIRNRSAGRKIAVSEMQPRIWVSAAGTGAEIMLFHAGVDMAALEAVERRLAPGLVVEAAVPPIVVDPETREQHDTAGDSQQERGTEIVREHGTETKGERGKRKTRLAGARTRLG
jgi:hypothetical protein